MLDRKALTEDEIEALYARIAKDYGRQPPLIEYAEGRGPSWANKFRIKLTGSYGKRLMVVIHEMAHYLDLSGIEGHGAPYVGVYIELLERYAGLHREGIEDVFRKCGFRFIR